ncbi:MAG: OsmC family protein [Desulfosarcina sp.]|nr:OsmC family protein [Desulfosarcina sp.]
MERIASLIADEPKTVGGAASGPAPYGFLLAGLGACTSMTIRMYAERKGISLEDIKIELEHDKIHASDCESCVHGTARTMPPVRLALGGV